jgi:hypothetical protein
VVDSDAAPARTSATLGLPVLRLAILGSLLGAIVVELVVLAGMVEIGLDYRFYRDVGARWIAEGTYYLPHQLAGPYDVTLMQDVLYPPAALLLFVPLVFVPAFVWWAVPITVMGVALHRLRPGPAGLAVAMLLFLWPRASAAYLYGNTDMWVAAGVAGGILWGWPAILVALKPTLAPLSLVGIRSPWWFVGAAVILAVSLPMLVDYITAMRNLRIDVGYSLGSLPLALIPIVFWVARTRPAPRLWPPRWGPARHGV